MVQKIVWVKNQSRQTSMEKVSLWVRGLTITPHHNRDITDFMILQIKIILFKYKCTSSFQILILTYFEYN